MDTLQYPQSRLHVVCHCYLLRSVPAHVYITRKYCRKLSLSSSQSHPYFLPCAGHPAHNPLDALLMHRLQTNCRVFPRRSNCRVPPPLQSHINTHAQHTGLPNKQNPATHAIPTPQDGSLDNTTPQKQRQAP
jgi:hypothetical protein